jgi:hypothetical protein
VTDAERTGQVIGCFGRHVLRPTRGRAVGRGTTHTEINFCGTVEA